MKTKNQTVPHTAKAPAVRKGQVYILRDHGRRVLEVLRISRKQGTAQMRNRDTGRESVVRLDRINRQNRYELSLAQAA